MQERTHQAKMVRHFGPNRARTKPVFTTFTFKQGQNTKSVQINNFQCILYIFTMNLNSISYIHYTPFYASKVFSWTIWV